MDYDMEMDISSDTHLQTLLGPMRFDKDGSVSLNKAELTKFFESKGLDYMADEFFMENATISFNKMR